ncbi:MAG: MarR family transcriptional regulator [Alphaproteobacteria bacterium CG_4_9_14_3_um_filter_47_13]|nr:MAG: MarR family transcriptional regulator [Alphaproteobacteria bacterium CG_4_9_14_3_um_filter_47_13]
MMNDTNIWLERLSSLYKSQMRKAAGIEGVQLVHFEILRYLSLCNKYSNTAQAVSEYLGQTKSSISQSLQFLENNDLIERKTDPVDKRFARLFLTKNGKTCLERMNKNLAPEIPDHQGTTEIIKMILGLWQKQNDHRSFGQCHSCLYNRRLENGKFQCGLTNETLTKSDTTKLCREHEFLADSL